VNGLLHDHRFAFQNIRSAIGRFFGNSRYFAELHGQLQGPLITRDKLGTPLIADETLVGEDVASYVCTRHHGLRKALRLHAWSHARDIVGERLLERNPDAPAS